MNNTNPNDHNLHRIDRLMSPSEIHALKLTGVQEKILNNGQIFISQIL